eukprot:scaffold179314_cov32-Tisochrysis_lutea.AAC.1
MTCTSSICASDVLAIDTRTVDNTLLPRLSYFYLRRVDLTAQTASSIPPPAYLTAVAGVLDAMDHDVLLFTRV